MRSRGGQETDVGGHEGDDFRGEYAQTLTVSIVFTGWTETKALRAESPRIVGQVGVPRTLEPGLRR